MKMTGTDQDLIRAFIRDQSQDAFTALVARHLNLVYSSALRQVRSPELAEDVSQTVFSALARQAGGLRPDTNLTAWLYQVTRHTAIDVIRGESRRQAREQAAFQMSAMNDDPSEWLRVEPLLDEAMQSLDDKDRTAVLLRYFENKSLREVGLALGTGEDAAQKRVTRAVDRLRDYFSRRKVAVGAGGLAALVSTHAVQAAPVGLTAAIAQNAVLASSLAGVAAASTLNPTIALAMTATQKIIVTVVLAGAIAAGVYQNRQATALRDQVQLLQQEHARFADLTNQLGELRRERDRATNRLASLAEENATLRKAPSEVQKLRGEVGRLRQENNEIGSTSSLGKAAANPEVTKLIREQQKMGMSMIYKSFADRAKLGPELTGKLNDVLADHVMENVDLITTVLREKTPPDQMNQLFAAKEAELKEHLQTMLSPEAYAQYNDYTKDLAGFLTGEQFKDQLAGDNAAKKEKSKQIAQLMREEMQASIASAGLPADYQFVPALNFRNIASESQGEQSIKLLDDVYQRVATRSNGILSPEEMAKFQEFRAAAVNNNRAALKLNRSMMAPVGH